MSDLDPTRTPVVIGTGQITNRDEPVTAVEMAARAAEAAFTDAPGMAQHIERLSMVAVSFSPVSTRPASEVAERLGLSGVACEVTQPGGNSPQWLVTRAAADIRAGQLDTTLIVGGEATRSMRAQDKNANFLTVARGNVEQEEGDPVVGMPMKGLLSRPEIKANATTPTLAYALLESARAHAAGRTPEAQRQHIAPLYARWSEIAAANPLAWFQSTKSPSNVGDVTAENRIICEPYTRCMNSFPNVDQGSALLVTTLERARAAGLADQCVFPWAGANASETPPLARPDLSRAPAIEAAAAACYEAAGVGVDDLAHIDIYSCFPSAVGSAADGLGVRFDDARDLTTTGGMSFFGGPGNNYSGHGIATVVGRIRESGELGVSTANGGILSKHSIGIYGATPPPRGFQAADTRAEQERIDASALPVVMEGSGKARVDASTLAYARDGSVDRAVAFVRLANGERTVANAEASLLQDLAGRSLVGEEVTVLPGEPCSFTL